MLRIVDGDTKLSMTFLHDAFLEAKKTIQRNFNKHEASYRPIIDILEKRWAKHYKSLVKVAFFLKPEFYYKIERDPETRDACAEFEKVFSNYINRMIPDDLERKVKVLSDMCLYKNRITRFEASTTSSIAETTHPLQLWEIFGMETVELRKLATRILSLCSSASSCKRNWSTFTHKSIGCFLAQ